MKNRNQIVEQLGRVLYVAARNQVAAGAQYVPGDELGAKDPEKIWLGVADALVNIVETAIRDNRELENG